jgi:hypothetical protein
MLLAAVLAAASLFVRWLCCWRNLRRFLMGVAGILILIATGYAEENWRGKHAWQRHLEGLEAKGERVTISALMPSAVPEERNLALAPLLKPLFDYYHGPAGLVWRDTNGLARLQIIAADLVSQRDTNNYLVLGQLEKGTFADLTACALFYRGNTNYPQAAPEASPAEVVLTALGRFAPEMRELQEAVAARPESRFPIHYEEEPSWNILLPHLARVKSLTLLVHVRATAALDAGRSAEAFGDLKLGLRLSGSIRDEPLLIDHLVRIATLGLDLQTVREGLRRHAWSEAELTELEGDLSQVNILAEYRRAMCGERAFETQGLDFLRRQGFRSDPMSYLASEEGSSDTTPPLGLMPRGLFYQNMLTISRFFEDFILPVVDDRGHRVSPDLSARGYHALEAMGRGPYTLIAKLLLPALQNSVQKSARMQAYVDATRVACAVERYLRANGNLPASLDLLAPSFIGVIPGDVIDGKPLRYRAKPDGEFILYSIGWNQKDNGGELAWAKPKETVVDITQGDWVWRMAAR